MSVPGPSSPDGALTRPPYCLEAGEPTPGSRSAAQAGVQWCDHSSLQP
uniref:Biogenesis of lysosomal organelles complex 1 subunit 6 n=1 Tax=Homo sapiens TaxID=9606 RepID=A0A5F9ZHH0_HUMAN